MIQSNDFVSGTNIERYRPAPTAAGSRSLPFIFSACFSPCSAFCPLSYQFAAALTTITYVRPVLPSPSLAQPCPSRPRSRATWNHSTSCDALSSNLQFVSFYVFLVWVFVNFSSRFRRLRLPRSQFRLHPTSSRRRCCAFHPRILTFNCKTNLQAHDVVSSLQEAITPFQATLQTHGRAFGWVIGCEFPLSCRFVSMEKVGSRFLPFRADAPEGAHALSITSSMQSFFLWRRLCDRLLVDRARQSII